MRVRLSLLAATFIAGTASAQSKAPDPNDIRAVLHGGLGEVANWITKSADMVPADKYTYKPVATVRTFGQLVAHVADGMNWYCKGAAAGKMGEWSDATEKGKTDKATVTAALKTAISGCHASTNTGTQLFLVQNVAHSSLHYGNIITYLRMMGMVPPSS